MKKAISGSLLLYIGLFVAIVVIFLIFTCQQREKTEKTVFGTIWQKFFPSKMEIVVVPGTTVGGGCPTIALENADQVAQAAIDCWKQGKTSNSGRLFKNVDMSCCYKLNPAKLKQTITKQEVLNVLRNKGHTGSILADSTCGGLAWKIADLYDTASPPTVCYDVGICDEVYITRTPLSDCS